MTYCHKCGNKTKEEDSFCERCGEKIGEFLHEIEKDTEKIVKKTSYMGLVIFILILVLIGYICLDIWAATQIRPEMSLDSLWTTVSNMDGNLGITSASASTKLKMENPTFVPVFLFPIKMKAGYDDVDVIEGRTGFVFILPYSNSEIIVRLKASYLQGGLAAIKGIINLFKGEDRDFYAEFYELGIKFAEVRG